MEKKYNFELTLAEAQVIVAGLKKLPMDAVEALVANLERQYSAQTQPPQDNAAQDAAKQQQVLTAPNRKTRRRLKAVNVA